MFKRKCKITFISHGATIHSEENRISKTEDYPPLNDCGQDEIDKICLFLKKRAIKSDQIYSSPALRTIQSADMVSKVLRQDFEILDDLTGRKHGVWSGLTYENIEDKYPQMLEKLHEDPCSFCPEGAETLNDFNKRIKKSIKKIVDKNVGNRIIIVTYPDIIQAAICLSLKIPPQNQAKIYIKTGSATQISYFENWASLMYSGYVPL